MFQNHQKLRTLHNVDAMCSIIMYVCTLATHQELPAVVGGVGGIEDGDLAIICTGASL
jgi:hypothetical protein